jgi:hypothetical protein
MLGDTSPVKLLCTNEAACYNIAWDFLALLSCYLFYANGMKRIIRAGSECQEVPG